ncbi:MAG: L-threonylcarbamoyladenylate synthase [Gammaproteobacteria bacterium]|nr:L-threonylcarbamoyladenylate synthase [Gammaproteobacteria bacterium]
MTARLHVERAARIVLAGGVVAYPTEAVFGLGCLPEDRAAVERILAIKGRSWRKGLLLIGSDLEQLTRFAILDGSPCREEILQSWPGPNTWVLRATPAAPDWITGGRDSVGVRLTAHPIARALCARVGSALVSTSANFSRRRPATRALGVRRALGTGVDYVLPGAVGDLPTPTRIRDGRSGRTLRPG